MRISLAKAYQLLMSGHVVSVPTETVYGLAASIERPGAINEIFSLKGRPSNNPLIIHVANVSQILPFVHSFPHDFSELTDAFWPGPLTLILPTKPDSVPFQACAGLPTAAFRVPNHSLTLALLEWVGPFVMPSANLSGKPSATRREHVETDFGQQFPVVDGGCCEHGLESTILQWNVNRWQIVRLGAISSDQFGPVIGYEPEVVSGNKLQNPVCPGQLYRHYAPKAKLELCLDCGNSKGVVLGFSERQYSKATKVFILGDMLVPETVAENLYSRLRQLDDEGVEAACVDMDFPKNGLWETIRERLVKASQVK